MTIAAALELAIQLLPVASSAVVDLINLLHGGASGTDPAPYDLTNQITDTKKLLDQAKADAGL